MEKLIEKIEKVDEYFIEKMYSPSYELRLNLREAIDYIKMNEQQKKCALEKSNTENGKLVIQRVSQQSELLKAFCNILLNAGDLTQQISDDEIDGFLKSFNCG